MAFVGIDPDLHTSGIAVIDDESVVWCQVARVSDKLKGRDAVIDMCWRFVSQMVWGRNAVENVVCVEAQEAYLGKLKSPQDLLHLAAVAGAALALPAAIRYFPLPKEWKGNVPKQINQARTFSELGWAYGKSGSKETGYCYPTDNRFEHLKKSDWKHVGDALGLALYAKERYQKELRHAELKQTYIPHLRTKPIPPLQTFTFP